MEVGQLVQIESLKHDGSHHRLWKSNKILYVHDHIVIGKNNGTVVVEKDKEAWTTKEPAIFYFDDCYWFHIIILFGDRHYYYCNMASPITYADGTISYIDYDIDIIVDEHLSYNIVDEDEFILHKKQYQYEPALVDRILEQKNILIEWIEKKKGPFHPSFLEKWSKEIDKGR